MKPIIDVHAHVFSARDIPLAGYLRARDPLTAMEKALEFLHLRSMLIPALAKYIRLRNLNSNTDLTLGRIAFELVSAIQGKQYKGWAETLSKSVIEIAREMLDTYKDQIDLYVPLLIDFEYWFESTVDIPIKEQIEYIYKNIVLPYEGRVHPFVAFDPARELAYEKHMLNPDGKPELDGSMALVKDAIENKGFIGVKLYNALGYRPFNNETVAEKRRDKIKLHKKMGYHVFTGDDYDRVLSKLYRYCADKEVPITAHCVMEGIESYRDASFDFGQAVFWHEVLSQSRFKNLRLNLAHFGWNGKQGYPGNRSWVRDICTMLPQYDFLYTDVSHHRVTVRRSRDRFKSDYDAMCSDFRDTLPEIKRKLLFGIDWHVFKRERDFKSFKDGYLEVLKHNGFTPQEIEDFLGGNALRFLGLLPGGQNRQRLEDFYNKKNIKPPQWFASTASPAPTPAVPSQP